MNGRAVGACALTHFVCDENDFCLKGLYLLLHEKLAGNGKVNKKVGFPVMALKVLGSTTVYKTI